MKRLIILGSTGSVGRNAVEVASYYPDEFEIVGLAAGGNVAELRKQLNLFPNALFSVGRKEAYDSFAESGEDALERCIGTGEEAIIRLIKETSPDLLVNCIVGFAGLRPTLFALEEGIPVATANKEAIVTGGEILLGASRKSGAPLIPIDSEHVGISQCLEGRDISEVRRVYITSSGGALREKPIRALSDSSVKEVLQHPTWNMGDKITVDSATMINKGLEVIEAHWLFSLPYEKIAVVIHPQSIVHSMVEYQNGSVIAQMSFPDMRLPILHALSYPERLATDIARMEVTDFPSLSFRKVDTERYPCLQLAMQAARQGGNSPTVLNSANEEAVSLFLSEKIGFSKIFDIIEYALDEMPFADIKSLDDIFDTDRKTRDVVRSKYCTD